MTNKSIAIIGGGAAGMAVASFLNERLFNVTIYERNKALGRKFLVAGKGGFNLTHGESLSLMKSRYHPRGFMDRSLEGFSNEDFRNWLTELGIPTFVGTSNRVFPIKGIKPINVLQKIINHLTEKKVNIVYDYQWKGEQIADIVIYALGGASWAITGSDGSWADNFSDTLPFKASNCAFKINWPKPFIEVAEGKPLKNIVQRYKENYAKGEVVITNYGLEGGAIYQLSYYLVRDIYRFGKVEIHVDLKKDTPEEVLLSKLSNSREKTLTNALKRDCNLSRQAIALLKNILTKNDFLELPTLAYNIKHLPLTLHQPAPISEAISTTGGINLEMLNENFELKGSPDHYCIGEMSDWNAPTGGYLLQACFSMGHHLATNLNARHL